METMYRIWLVVAIIAGGANLQAGETYPLVADCSAVDDVVASLQGTDHVHVRYALGGSAQTCYSVSAVVNGQKVEGYLLGTSHPDVAAFERDARSHVPELPPPPPPPAAAPAAASGGEATQVQPATDIPKSFAGLSGISPTGRRVSVDGQGAPMLVLYFWSANDKQSIREVDGMDGIHELYRGKGVSAVGVVSASSPAQARRVISDGEMAWPQILDTNGAIAARYPASKQTRYFILDRNRNVVAALKTSNDVHRALARLRGQTGGAE